METMEAMETIGTMGSWDQDAWDRLCFFGLVNNSWTSVEKIFAIELWKNNFDHVKETYHQIDVTKVSRIQDMFIISAMNSGMDSNTSTFLFLNNVWSFDSHYMDEHRLNCLLSACASNGNLSFIRYLIDDMGMCPFHKDVNNSNCLIWAGRNANLEIVNFFVKKFEGIENHVNKSGANCFLVTCSNNQNVDIVKYLAQSDKVNTMIVDKNGRDCFLHACSRGNVDILKYLINDLKINTSRCDNNGDNCLTLACWMNPCVDVIKFLIHCVKTPVNHLDKSGSNCLLAASLGGNIDVIKFLINDVNMSVDHKNINGSNCLTIANLCKNIKKRLKTIEYLINETNVDINVIKMDLETFQCVVSRIRDSGKLNSLVQKALFCFPMREANKALSCMNPFLLNLVNRKDVFGDVFEKQYQDIKNWVLDFHKSPMAKQKIELDPMIENIGPNTWVRTVNMFDFTRHSEYLFTHGSVNYYGHREIVYGSNILLKEMYDDQMIDLTHGFVLQGNLPEKIINQYIASAYTGFFDIQLSSIEDSEEHFIDFLKFIDQYPMTNASIDKLEHWITGYIETHSHIMNQNQEDIECLKMMCDRYMMKRLCVVLHNLACSG
jgi:ankyrin repeat protein